jgi:two-component system, NtrC family, sensor kinase
MKPQPSEPSTAKPATTPSANLPPEQELALFRRLTLAVNTSMMQDDVFDAIGHVLRDYFQFDGLTLAILAPNLQGIGRIIHIDVDGFADTRHDNHRYTGTDPLLEPILAHDAKPHMLSPEANPASVLLPPYRCHAAIYPIFTKQQPIGIMVMNRHQRFEAFSLEEQALLDKIRPLIGMALEHARLYNDIQTLVSRQFLMNSLSVKIRQTLDVSHILKTAANELGQVLGVNRCLIHSFREPILLNRAANQLGEIPPPEMIEALCYSTPNTGTYTPTPEFDHPYRFEWDVLTQHSDSHGKPLARVLQPFFFYQEGHPHNESWKAPKGFYDRNQIQSVSVVPILSNDAWVGSITLHQCNKVRVWLHEDRELLGAIAEHMGLAMTQARLFQQKTHALDELQQTQMHLVQSEKMAMLGQFVAGIAHEVNTPLGTMMANTQTLQKLFQKLDSQTPPPQKLLTMATDVLSLNEMAGERIKETVVNLRNFARLDESERKTVDIHEGLQSTLLLMKNSLPKRMVVQRDYGEGIPDLKCFPGLLNQVYMNLMVNANHATEHLEAPTLTIRTRMLNDVALGTCLSVQIEDNGKGISPEHMSRIFDPGFTTKSRGVGTGLGLALCFRIVEKHQGRIDVSSTPDVGTTFDVRIPYDA